MPLKRVYRAVVECPSVTVVIVNYRSAELSLQAVSSLVPERDRFPGLRAIIADGGSGDGSADRLAEALDAEEFRGWAELMALPINGGFGWANNQAILAEMRRGNSPEFFFLLNPDAQVTPGAMSALVDHLSAHPRCAAAGAQLLDVNGEPQSSAHRFPSVRGEFIRASRTGIFRSALGDAGTSLPIADRPCQADWVSGAGVMLRTEALRQTGLFDDGFFLYFEEVELMWRLKRAGWEIWYVPSAKVIHLHGAITGAVETPNTRMPAYWYQSQRRYFALTRGRPGAGAALAAWLLGHSIWLIRHRLGIGKDDLMYGAGRDRLRHGMPRRSDASPSVAPIDGGPGAPPAWMRKVKP